MPRPYEIRAAFVEAIQLNPKAIAVSYGGISPSELKHMRQLEEENLRLKKLVADLSLDKAMLQDVLAKKN